MSDTGNRWPCAGCSAEGTVETVNPWTGNSIYWCEACAKREAVTEVGFEEKNDEH